MAAEWSVDNAPECDMRAQAMRRSFENDFLSSAEAAGSEPKPVKAENLY